MVNRSERVDRVFLGKLTEDNIKLKRKNVVSDYTLSVHYTMVTHETWTT